MNNLVISGNIGQKAPELQTTRGGTPVVEFSVAVRKGWGDSEKTIWFTVRFWHGKAEAIARHFSAGDPIICSGEVDFECWIASRGRNAGEATGKITLDGRDFSFINGGGSGDRNTTPPPEPPGGGAQHHQQSSQHQHQQPATEDDGPF